MGQHRQGFAGIVQDRDEEARTRTGSRPKLALFDRRRRAPRCLESQRLVDSERLFFGLCSEYP